MPSLDDLRFLYLTYGVTELLREAGYHSLDDLRRATDEELLAIHGIGQHYLHVIRLRLEQVGGDAQASG